MVCLCMAIVGAVHAVRAFVEGVGFSDTVLLDTDAYTWVVRAEYLLGEGGWLDKALPRVNPPEGHLQHWTRPTDVILAVGGWAFGLVAGSRAGLYWWSVVFPPLIHVLSIPVVHHAALRVHGLGVLRREHVPLVLLVFVAQPTAYLPFLAGRPDHHALLALAFIGSLALWISLVERSRSDEPHPTNGAMRPAVLLGLVQALALWVNPECLIYMAVGMAFLVLHWAWSGAARERLSLPLGVYGSVLGAGVFLAAFAEWGGALRNERWMDVISLPHVALFVGVAIFWWILYLGSGPFRRSGSRIGLAGAAALLAVGPVVLVFPEFVGDPLAATDPVYRVTRLERIAELQPLLGRATALPGEFGEILLLTTLAIPAGVLFAWLALKARDGSERAFLLHLVMLLLAYLALAFRQVRWVDYLGVASTIPIAVVVASGLTMWGSASKDPTARVIRTLTIFTLLVGPLGLGLYLRSVDPGISPPAYAMDRVSEWTASASVGEEERTPRSAFDPCPLRDVAAVLNDPTEFPEAVIVLAHPDHGPELLFRTRHSVLSIPNHRPQPGYHLTRAIMNETEVDASSAELAAHNIGAVLLCLSDLTVGFFGADGTGGLAGALGRGEDVRGLGLVAEGRYFRLFRVQD
jgi:hypothetical protein